MESFLIGKDLWDVVGGNNRVASVATEKDVEVLKNWKMVNVKAEFVLKRTIMNCSSTLWVTGRLQYLEYF